ncbi:MAG TPA: citrate synthase [Candidatus Baltobacteraceae bacterium]|nr:citrate synthase [Candidatus Baltobacteraceae bacterium]
MSKEAKLELDGKSYALPTLVGTENEKAVDISTLRQNSGYITLDEGYGNTGACISKITFIDGDQGILRYRGIPIDELAEKSNFIETAYLIIYGTLPTRGQLKKFSDLFTEHQFLHEDMKYHFESFSTTAHPMAILSAMINASSCFDEGLMKWQWGKANGQFDNYAAKLMSQVRTIAAYSYRKAHGLPLVYPKKTFKYTANFLHMMYSSPYEDYDIKPEVVKALDLIFLLHADHEQNCSTSTVRMVASSQANLFASCSAGVCALWGPLHGGANQAVLEMLEEIHKTGDDGSKFIVAAKDKNSGKKLMGFGHRVYKNYDPRAKIIKKSCDEVLAKLKINDPLLDIAKRLEEAALKDSYFVERKLYPNVDFYSGIIMRAIGIPVEMFPVMFAIGRMPGWIANYKEIMEDPKSRISRPRQIYTGPTLNHYVPLEERK